MKSAPQLPLSLLCTFLVVVLMTGCELGSAARQRRLFSIFNVIRFAQAPCVDETGDCGTCMTSTQCLALQGGVPVNHCAAGFGVCCKVTASTCGSTVTQNTSYIQNPGFPSAQTAAGTCEYTISKISANICYIRLDFVRLEIANPPTNAANGQCSVDVVTFTQGTNAFAPPLCGVSTGLHMYLEAGAGSAGTQPYPITVTHTFTGSTTSRFYRYKVCQIPCATSYTPPPGCGMYFTGVSGTITSYNFQSGNGYKLTNQYYRICIRQEVGRCKIVYKTTTPTSFRVSRQATNTATARTGDDCKADYVQIQQGRNVISTSITGCMGTVTTPGLPSVDRFCGSRLNCISTSLTGPSANTGINLPIVSDAGAPFNIYVSFDSTDPAIQMPNLNYGFELDYLQLPC